MLNIKFICVGKLKEKFYIDAQKEYVKRITGFCKPEIIELPEHRLPPEPSAAQIELALKKEGEAIERKLSADAIVIALCVEGKQMDSLEFSTMIADYMGNGGSRICFLIGGSFGLCQRVKERADVKLSVSKMTFPHHLARVILLEQIYRGFKIIDGGKYHK